MDKKTTLKERTDLVIAFVVILISGTFIYSKITTDSHLEEFQKSISIKEVHKDIFVVKNDEKNSEGTCEIKSVEARPIKTTNRQRNEDLQIVPVFSFPTSSSNLKSEISTNIDEVVIEESRVAIEQEEPEYKTDKEITHIDTIQEQFSKNDDHIKIKDSIIEDSNIKKTFVKKDSVAVKNSSLQKQSISKIKTGCTAVVGVFKQIANKNNVIKKLIELGYAHEQGVLKNGLTYVGVPVACESQLEKRNLISELNKAFNVEAWVKKNN